MGPNNFLNEETGKPQKAYTVSAMDYVFDYSLRMSLCFVITQEVEDNYILILNVIEFQQLEHQWSKK